MNMKWFKNRDLLTKILFAGLSTIVLLNFMTLAVASYFDHKVDLALSDRKSAFEIRIAMLQALVAEKDFLLRDGASARSGRLAD